MSEATTKAVFLSYASQDADAAKRIADALRAAGVEVWFDQNELVGGDAWDQSIRRQIKDCALLIPIISTNTQARTEGYFRLEWRLADQRTHLMAKGRPFLLPVVIDATRDADAHVPDSFLEVQWTRLPGGETPPAFGTRVQKLLNPAAAEARGPGPEVKSGGGPAASPADRKVGRRVPATAWAAGLTAALAVVAFLLWRRPASGPTPGAGAGTRPPTTEKTAAPLTEAQKLIQQAQKIYEDSDELDRETLTLADDLVKRALALDPAEPAAWLLGAQLSYAMVWQSFDGSEARTAELQRQAARARALAPDSVPAQLAVANARVAAAYLNYKSASNRQDLAGVERDLLALAERAPRDYQVQRALAQTYRFLKRPDEALRALMRAVELSGGDPGVSADLINVLLRRKRYAEAEAFMAPALARRPTGRLLVFDVFVKTRWRGDLAGAQAALATWPGWLLREDRGAFIAWQTWLWSGQPDRALDVAQRLPRDYLRDVWFTGPRAVLTARAHEMAGHREAAQTDWRTVVRLADQELAGSPDDVPAMFWKTWALSRLGDQAGAEAVGTLLRQRVTTQTVFLNSTSLSLLWSTMGRIDLAAAHLRTGFGADDDTYEVTRAMMELDPAYAPLRADPHFPELAALAPAAPPAAPMAKADDKSTPSGKSVAVLAFANLSDDKGNEYFSDGISEELLNVLAKVPGLKVTARTSSFYFKDKEVQIPEIARQLGVAYVVEGSVRKQGDKVRITAQLIKAADGFHVWSDTFTRDLKDIFAVQDEIAGLIARNLQAKLADPVGHAAVNPEAYNLVLQARHAARSQSSDGWLRAVEDYRRAIEVESRYALAWAELARCYVMLGRFRGMPTVDAMREARKAAQTALEIDPNQATGLAVLGWIQRTADWDWKGAEKSFQRALALAPDDLAIMSDVAICWFNLGRIDEGIALAKQVVERDPINAESQWVVGWILAAAGHFEDSLPFLRRAIELAPTADEYHSHLARTLTLLGRFEEAEAAARQEPKEEYRLNALTLIAHLRGDRGSELKYHTEFQNKYGQEMPGYTATLYALEGRIDEASPLWIAATLLVTRCWLGARLACS